MIDETGPATGSTAAGMGHIVVMDDSEAQFALCNYSQQLWNKLAEELPKDSEYEHCGTMWVAADDEEMDEVRRKREFYAEREIAAEILDEKSLRTAEPNLREALAGGLRVPGDSVVYQLRATDHLLNTASGANLITGIKAIAIEADGVRLENGEKISAKYVVNAAGIGSPELSPELPIVPRKGHLVITDRYPGFVSHQLIELGYLKSAHGSDADSVAFNVQPRKTGQMLIGSSRQFGVDHSDIDQALLRRMTERAFEYMPKLRGISAIRAWTGFRPATPDNLPYIGRIGETNVFAACGHEGLGITTSLASAELIADEVLGRPSAIDRTPYSPNRKVIAH